MSVTQICGTHLRRLLGGLQRSVGDPATAS